MSSVICIRPLSDCVDNREEGEKKGGGERGGRKEGRQKIRKRGEDGWMDGRKEEEGRKYFDMLST